MCIRDRFEAVGNGRLDAISNALKMSPYTFDYKFITYSEHALSSESSSKAAAYVCIEDKNGDVFWGVGTHEEMCIRDRHVRSHLDEGQLPDTSHLLSSFSILLPEIPIPYGLFS